ncbi:MAG: outer membrane lipoprotein-sorting protein [Bacteroidales bacterium]|nr:outer membrane lipoprotein-sorting protein [Bacteroidales bacterium]
MKTIKLSVAITILILLSGAQKSFAQMTGQQIMEKVYNNPSGDDIEGELTMTLVDARGQERVRQLKQFTKDYKGAEKKIMFFISPADVRNTSFMNWSYTDGRDDDQWIYLPALNRVRRISSEGKSDYFMGSDFTYDDLGDRNPSEDNHKLLREENIDGKVCYVIESTPKNPGYMYSKTHTWVMKDNFLGLKREFYDNKGKQLKTLTINKYDKITGYWIILETEMKNVQKNHKTHMKFNNVKINQGISDSRFTERSMALGL